MTSLLQIIMLFIAGMCIGFSARPGFWKVVALAGGIIIVGSYYV